jgi:hypothetical protein
MTADQQQPPRPRPNPDIHTGNRQFDAYLRENVDEETVLLGSVVLMSVGSVDAVTHADLRDWFTELELATAYLPAEPRAVDAYERATGSAKSKYPLGTHPNGRKKQTHEKTGQTVTLMMRHVVRDETRIVRHLVRELADHADEALSYEVKLAEAEFEREIGPTVPVGSGDMTLTTVDGEIGQLGDFERATIAELIGQIHKDYAHACRYIPSSRVSKMLRDYLEDRCCGIRLQNGVYFVPRQHSYTLGALRELAGRCGAQINRIPVPDTAEQRAMVGDAFNAKCGADLDSLARDIAREQADGAAPYRVAKLHKRFLEVKREAQEYRTNLGAELGDTAARLDLINSQMANLFTSVGAADEGTDEGGEGPVPGVRE